MLRDSLNSMPMLVMMSFGAGALMLPFAFYAYVITDFDSAMAFFYSAVVVLSLSVMVAIARARPENESLENHRQAGNGLASFIFAYFLLPLVFALPFLVMFGGAEIISAWFEMVSCFTTTGASAYGRFFDDTGTQNALPVVFHLWRAFIAWLGGLFFLVGASVILRPIGLGGAEVSSGGITLQHLSAHNLHSHYSALLPRLWRGLKVIFPLYSGATALLWFLLLSTGSESIDALVHAMATLSTSGVTAQTGPSGGMLFGTDELFIAFFLLAAITHHWQTREVRVKEWVIALIKDAEVRLGAILIFVAATALSFKYWHSIRIGDFFDDIKLFVDLFLGSLFSALSFLTTTGFVSPTILHAQSLSGSGTGELLFVGLAIIGGGVLTTAGGVKLLRIYALLRHGERELQKMLYPSSVGGGGGNARKLRREGAYFAWLAFMLFAISISIVAALLTFLGVALEPAIIYTISALSTTGPLADIILTNHSGYGALSPVIKWILAITMIVGRLEVLAIIVMLAPVRWMK